MAQTPDHVDSSDGEVFRKAWDNSFASVSYGLSFDKACAKHVSTTFKASRVLLIASGSLSRETDEVKNLQDALGSRLAFTYSGLRPHTPWSQVLEITEKGREFDIDLLVTLGAGSITDCAKIVSLALANGAESFEDLHRLHSLKDEIAGSTVPIVSIPTSLSGGEYSHNAGGSNDDDQRKYSFAGPIKGPSVVILDQKLTTTTPDRWWLSSGVRAIDHCVECLCSLESTPGADSDATEGLKRLSPGLLACKKDRQDLKARLECQLGVIDALRGVRLHRVPMGASHGIGHQLGPLGVGHGETSCILLPAVCKYNIMANEERQERVKALLWSDDALAEVFKHRGLSRNRDLADLLDAFFRELGMPRSLQDAGLDGNDEGLLDRLAANSLHDRYCPTNPRPLREKAEVLEILGLCKG